MTIQSYAPFITFQAGVHNIILQPWQDPKKQAQPMPFMVTKRYVAVVVQDWVEEWYISLNKEMDRGDD